MFISANDSQVAELAVTYFQILHFVSRKCREFSSSDAMFTGAFLLKQVCCYFCLLEPQSSACKAVRLGITCTELSLLPLNVYMKGRQYFNSAKD